MQCIEACETHDAVPVCISSVSEASFIENDLTKERIPMVRKNGVFVEQLEETLEIYWPPPHSHLYPASLRGE